jgi:hypothetical protein
VALQMHLMVATDEDLQFEDALVSHLLSTFHMFYILV